MKYSLHQEKVNLMCGVSTVALLKVASSALGVQVLRSRIQV